MLRAQQRHLANASSRVGRVPRPQWSHAPPCRLPVGVVAIVGPISLTLGRVPGGVVVAVGAVPSACVIAGGALSVGVVIQAWAAVGRVVSRRATTRSAGAAAAVDAATVVPIAGSVGALTAVVRRVV